jgi:pimeloyl-ACP methyl ester carboxylesterase
MNGDNRWIQCGTHSIASTWFRPTPGAAHRGVTIVVVPGYGYSELAARYGWWRFADVCAAAGFTTVMFDQLGTGNSDTSEVSATLDQWVDGVHAVVATVGTPVVLVGARLGATVALAAQRTLRSQDDIRSTVLWAPILSGRRFVRELTVLASTSARKTETGALCFGGFDYPTSLLESIKSFEGDVGGNIANDVDLREPLATPRMMVLDDPTRPLQGIVKQNLIRSFAAEIIEAPETSKWLDDSSEASAVPMAAIESIVEWLVGQHSVTSSEPLQTPSTSDTAGVNGTTESFERVGVPRLATVIHRPVLRRFETAVILFNSGVERALGPGGEWVSAARRWCEDGFVVLRVDQSSTGDSGQWPNQPRSYVYGPHGDDDLQLALDVALREGCDEAIVVGICSSAFSVLQVGPNARVRAIAAINPQLYRIGTPPGVVEEATNVTKYRLAKIDRQFGIRKKAHRLKALVGRHHPAFRWLEKYRNSGTAVTLMFGEGDRGIRFLERENEMYLNELQSNGTIRLVRFPGLDHALHDVHHRGAVLAELDRMVRDFSKASDRQLAHA